MSPQVRRGGNKNTSMSSSPIAREKQAEGGEASVIDIEEPETGVHLK